MKLGIFEILEAANKEKNKLLRAQILKQHDNQVLRMVLDSAFNPAVKWLLPPGIPDDIKKNKLPGQEEVLYGEARKFQYFIEGFHSLTRVKRERMFLQLLEVVHEKDADILIAIKDKKLPYKNITPDVVSLAFPDLMNEQVV